MVKLSIVILSYNTKDLTLNCINSIIEQYKEQLESGEFEIIVVDNASSDGTQEIIKKNYSYKLVSSTNNTSIKKEASVLHIRDNSHEPAIKLVENQTNLGFSKGNNVGAREAKGEFLLFLNSDTEVYDNGLIEAIGLIEQDKIGVLGLRLKNSDGSVQPSCGKFYNLLNTIIMLLAGERLGLLRSSPKNVQNVDWVSGASLLIKKKVFEQVDGFDEKLFMYTEDMELCFRVREKGLKVKFFPDIEIIHAERGSSNRSFAIQNIYRGILHFYRKHKPFWQFTLIKILLIIKARLAVFIGRIIKNDYLVSTYNKALDFVDL